MEKMWVTTRIQSCGISNTIMNAMFIDSTPAVVRCLINRNAFAAW